MANERLALRLLIVGHHTNRRLHQVPLAKRVLHILTGVGEGGNSRGRRVAVTVLYCAAPSGTRAANAAIITSGTRSGQTVRQCHDRNARWKSAECRAQEEEEEQEQERSTPGRTRREARPSCACGAARRESVRG